MARSKQKTLGQQVLGVAAVGMPEPVKKVVASRWGARLCLILFAVLLAAGIVTVQWKDGRPQIKVDQDRAQEVKQNLVRTAESAEGRTKSKDTSFPSLRVAQEPTEPGPIRTLLEPEPSKPNPTTTITSRFEAATGDAPSFREAATKLLPRPFTK